MSANLSILLSPFPPLLGGFRDSGVFKGFSEVEDHLRQSETVKGANFSTAMLGLGSFPYFPLSFRSFFSFRGEPSLAAAKSEIFF